MKSTMEESKRSNKPTLILIIMLLLLCLFHGISAVYQVNFAPINGSFQNYNPVRRILDGQVPYRDFTLYLGLGHAYIGSVFTLIFGNNFAGSLIAFCFLTISSLVLFSIIIGYSIMPNHKNVILSVTLLLVTALLIQPKIFTNALSLTDEFSQALSEALSPGNSARFIRGMAPLALIITLWFCSKIISKTISKKLSETKINYIILLVISVLLGFAFLWSNDFGISSWICGIIMITFIAAASSRKFKTTLIVFLSVSIISLLSIFLFVGIFSAGNIVSWFNCTIGTGGYQAWYYNSSKTYYLYEIDFSFVMLLQAGMCIFYLYKLFKLKATKIAIHRYGVLAFLNMVGFAAANEYKLLSGGHVREVALSILFLTFTFEGFGFLLELVKSNLKFETCILRIGIVCGLSCLMLSISNKILPFVSTDRGTYVEKLGGYLTSLDKDLETAKIFIGDKKIFSTYSSALETISDQFQPSGTDYIIHVLGDKARAAYLSSFKEDDFTYVTTISESYNDWEYWVKNSNWFFYRELYQNYYPVFANSYQIFWQKNNFKNFTNSEKVSIESIQDDAVHVTLKVQTAANITGVADVLVEYNTQKDKSLQSKFILNQMVRVTNTSAKILTNRDEFYFLRDDNTEYIPITVVNGYGEVTLTSEPTRNTTLSVESITCDNVYTVDTHYAEIIGQALLRENNTTSLSFLNTPKNRVRMTGVDHISIGAHTYAIQNIEVTESEIIVFIGGNHLEEMNELLPYNNICLLE